VTQPGPHIIARRDGVILRPAREEDLPRVDDIIIECYTPIHESFLAIVGEDVYRVLRRGRDPDWKADKLQRIQSTFGEETGHMWVLEADGAVFGFVTFQAFAEQSRLWIEENGVLPERRGQGWATFMLRHVLDYARELGIRFASVEVDLDDAHIAARRAYQAVGFDRHHHIAIYHQDLARRNPGSTADDQDP